MTETGPVFLVIVRRSTVFEPAPHSFFTSERDAWDYVETLEFEDITEAQVLRFDGLYAYTLRAMHKLALRELRKQDIEERTNNAETETQAEASADSQ